MATESADCRVDSVIRAAMKTDNSFTQRFNNECSLESRQQILGQIRERSDQKSQNSAAFHLGNLEIVGDVSKGKLEHVGTTRVASDRAAARVESKPVQDTGMKGVDDADTRSWRQLASPEQRRLGEQIAKDILKGNNVTESLGQLKSHAETLAVMAVIKGELTKDAKRVSVVDDFENTGNRSTFIETAKGVRILLEESKVSGAPRDVQVNTGPIAFGIGLGTKDVFDRPGDAEARKAAEQRDGGPTLLQRLAGGANLIDGKGPLARAMRGEPLSAEDERQLQELSKGGKVILYKPKGGD